jgi:hypothetical protein
VLAAVVGCNNVDQFLHHFYHLPHRHDHPAVSAFVSPVLSLLDIGARAAASCLAPSTPACFPANNPQLNDDESPGDVDVTCSGGGDSGPVAQKPVGAFSGVVLLQLLPISSAAAAAAAAAAAGGADFDGWSQALVSDVQAAAGSIKTAEHLGLVTSLAGHRRLHV